MDRLIVPFMPWHYEWLIAARKSAERWPVRLNSSTLEGIAAANTWTAVVDGQPVAVAGTVKKWEGRHLAWAYIGDDCGPHMAWITRAVLRNLATIKGRLELTVRADFAEGHRWARLLGFKVETPCLEKFGPDGADHTGYVRIN